jgi:uncharacterized membrane protein
VLFLAIMGGIFTVIFAVLWYLTWVESGKHLARARAAEKKVEDLATKVAYLTKSSAKWRDMAQRLTHRAETLEADLQAEATPPSAEEIAYVRKSLGQNEE